jgi:hypothetical protein
MESINTFCGQDAEVMFVKADGTCCCCCLLKRHIFSLLSKNESKLIKSPVCLCMSVSVCPPLITFEPHGRFS